MKKLKKLPTIAGILILIIGVGVGVYLVQFRQVFKLSASPELTPQDVRVTNVTDTSFAVGWTTDRETVGFVSWGENQNVTRSALPDDTSAKNIHWVTLRNLSPNSVYLFKINSAKGEFDNGGIPWQVQTGSTLETSESQVLSGTVQAASGQPAAGVIVYITAGGVSPLSAQTSASGSWVVPLNLARSSNLQSTSQFTQSSPLLEIFVQGGPLGVASANIYPGAANPTPQIILGQTHDFRNQPPNQASELPESSIGIPEEASRSSGFNIPDQIATSSAETVTLESVGEGEIITTITPEFLGEGPPGTDITVTIESSSPITQALTVNSLGNWSWSPPEGLEEGSHKITVSWRDDKGVLRELTRNFVVSAAEGPAFESTPSATPTSSPTPTPTPTPKATAAATPVSTSSATPDAGSLTPTILLTIMGIGLLVASYVIKWILPKTQIL